ncbi:rab11 family-interacting protein 1 isoform X1 [Centroberyx affinis]|uniref:rab11 family-interacting protein 1 isoform X1 n=1 Tax=Centroberyx affinis TaxID=166261 RepID=UPI003A5C04B8
MSLADQSQQWCPTSVQVTVLQARGLRIKGKNGTNDAYAVMQVAKEKYSTSVAEKSVAPVWEEEAAFDLPPLLHHGSGGTERGTLHVHVLHRALVGPDKLLGQAAINLLELSEIKSRDKTEWFKLLDKAGKSDKDRGEVLLDIQFMRNNMTASMFDLSAPGKSRSRLGKFKDKVRGKKKEGLSDATSAVVPSFTQVLTDSEEEGAGDGYGDGAAGKEEKKKKHKLKSLFSPKSNLQKNMSQSMSLLPEKNSALSGSISSGLNVDSSEGKKKFKFMIHKRSGSSDSKGSQGSLSVPGRQKHGSAPAVEQSNLCINGSHVYCEEPPPRSSRTGSTFSLSSSGHGSMEDLRRTQIPESSATSTDSLRRQYSPWTEEEDSSKAAEEEEEEVVEEEETAEVERMRTVERRRKVEEEEEKKRLSKTEEKSRKFEEEESVIHEQREERRLEEDKIIQEEERAEEERKRQEEEEERVRKEEEESQRLAEEKRRLEEQERRRIEEEEKMKREEQERIRMEKERAEEERRRRLEEGERVRKEEEETRRLAAERRLEEQAEEKRRLEEQERRRIEEEEKMKREEQERIRMEKERAEEERRRRQEEEERVRKEEEEREGLAEERRLEEQERRRVEEEEKMKREEQERIRMEEERAEEERKRRQEERIRKEEEESKRLAEEKRRLEEQERRRIEEETIRREEQERIRMEERAEEERRRKQEEEEMVRKEEEESQRLVEEKRRLEEQERRRIEEEERIRMEEERAEEERKMKQEERVRKEQEERERLAEEKKRLEEQERRRIEEEKIRREEQERIRMEEERAEEESKRRQEEEERVRKDEEERERLAEEKKRLEEQERLIKAEDLKIQREKEKRRESMRREEEEKMIKDEEERMNEEKGSRKEEERARKEEDKLWLAEEGERLKREEKEERRLGGADETRLGLKVKVSVESSAPLTEVPSTNPFDDTFSNNPFEEIPNPPAAPLSRTPKVSTVQPRFHSAVPLVGSKEDLRLKETVYTDEKDPISAQRDKRPAPQPPGKCGAERQIQREQNVSKLHLAQMNKQSRDKDVKASNVFPQRLVQMIAPLSRSSLTTKNAPVPESQSSTNCSNQPESISSTTATSRAAKHCKGPAPSRPHSSHAGGNTPTQAGKDGPFCEPTRASSSDTNQKDRNSPHAPVAFGSNPFEDDEAEDQITAQDEITTSAKSIDSCNHQRCASTNTGSLDLAAAAPQTPDEDAASQTKSKSSKMARAPPPPAKKAAASSILMNQNTDPGLASKRQDSVTDVAVQGDEPQSEDVSSVSDQETPLPVISLPSESRPVTAQDTGEEAGGKWDGPPSTSRRLHPVKPLSPLEQQSASVIQGTKDTKSTAILSGVQEKVKVKGPYSQLTQEELISLVLKQDGQLSERDKKISELEQYIDNLLVRVIEENPSILMSLNSLKKDL